MTERVMRAKMRVATVEGYAGYNYVTKENGKQEQVHLRYENIKMDAVAKNGAYGPDGLDENNTFARFSPTGSLTLTIANQDLIGKVLPGMLLYVDFTEAPDSPYAPKPEPEPEPTEEPSLNNA